MRNYPTTIKEAAEFLDDARKGWYNEVDTTRLLKNPQSGKCSILGQLWKDKNIGESNEFSYNEARAGLFGFYNIHVSPFTPMVENQQGWLDEIKKRIGKKENI